MKNYKVGILLVLLLLLFWLLQDRIYLFLGIITIPKEETIKEIYDKNLYDKYSSLLNVVNIPDDFLYEYKYSRVLYQDVYDLHNKITIFHGDDYGFKENMIVIDNNGLIGIIKKVDQTTSEVSLISNRNLNLSVSVKGEYGILVQKNGHYYVEGLSDIDNLSVGDIVETSGIGHVIGGCKVGTIINKPVNNGVLTIEIQPSADLKNIHYVIVLKDTI